MNQPDPRPAVEEGPRCPCGHVEDEHEVNGWLGSDWCNSCWRAIQNFDDDNWMYKLKPAAHSFGDFPAFTLREQCVVCGAPDVDECQRRQEADRLADGRSYGNRHNPHTFNPDLAARPLVQEDDLCRICGLAIGNIDTIADDRAAHDHVCYGCTAEVHDTEPPADDPRDEDDDVEALWGEYDDAFTIWQGSWGDEAYDRMQRARRAVEAAIERRRGVAAPQAGAFTTLEAARLAVGFGDGEDYCGSCGAHWRDIQNGCRLHPLWNVLASTEAEPAVQAGGGDEAWGALDVAFQEWEVNREGPWTWQDVRDITRRVRSEREQAGGGLRAALDEADSFITSLYYRHRSSIPESELAEAERLVRLLTSLRAPARG